MTARIPVGVVSSKLPSIALAQAAAAPQQSSVVTDDSEIAPFHVAKLTDLNFLSVGSTSKRWRSLDVFVNVSALDPGTSGAISVLVYALNGGAPKTLVGSGRIVLTPLSSSLLAPSLNAPVWACAVRNVNAERFEVVALYQQIATLAVPVASVDFTLVASNVGADAPDSVGVVPMGPLHSGAGVQASQGAQGINGYSAPLLELMSFQAVNGVAAERYLHLHDVQSGVTPINTFAPLMSWPMGAAKGAGVAVDGIRYRARGFLRLVVSSTLLVTTTTADGAVSAMVR